MAKLNKKQLIAALSELGVEVDTAKKLTNPKLEKMLAKAEKASEKLKSDQGETSDGETPGRLEPETPEEDEPPATLDKEKDYLQKYQYGKEMPLGHVGTNPMPGTKKDRMKQQLLKQPRVRIIIPRSSSESPTIRLSVTLNGYRLDLPKQEYIEVPEQIAQIIMDSQNQQDAALLPFRIDRADEKTKKALE